MPRYYFDTDDNDEQFEDRIGMDVSGPKQARWLALAALPDMAAEKIPNGNSRVFLSVVRDGNGRVVFEGKLTLEGTWHPTS